MNGTLFETRTDEELRRDAVGDNQRRVHDALMGNCSCELTPRQRRVLECLRGRQGKLQAMSIAEVIARVGGGRRDIKADVRALVVTFGLPIVASRDGDDGGYFFAVTAEERISGTADYVKEIVALAQRIRVIRNLHDLRALFGQISHELEASPEAGNG
jgi:predicted transcriptional regulator